MTSLMAKEICMKGQKSKANTGIRTARVLAVNVDPFSGTCGPD